MSRDASLMCRAIQAIPRSSDGVVNSHSHRCYPASSRSPRLGSAPDSIYEESSLPWLLCGGPLHPDR